MLGLLHRIALGEAPNQLSQLFPVSHSHRVDGPVTRLSVRRHDFQFIEPAFGTDVMQRSLFGLTVVYNLLPPVAVESRTVKMFQSHLQRALRRASVAKPPETQLPCHSQLRLSRQGRCRRSTSGGVSP